MAPEVLNKDYYNYKADVWSLGTILFELLTGYSPFKDAMNKDQLKQKHKRSSEILSKSMMFSKDCLRFINYCLTYNPDLRPTWNMLLDHSFMQLPS